MNIIRYNYYFSLFIIPFIRLLWLFTSSVSNCIQTHFRANGKKLKYDSISIRYPKNIAVGYCSSIYWNGTGGFEQATWLTLKHFIKSSDFFLDVGSNTGFYSVLAKKINPSIVVHAFEPIPEIFNKNIKFHKINKVKGNLIHKLALSDRTGKSKIYLPPSGIVIDEATTASLNRENIPSGCKHYEVTTITLDDFTYQYLTIKKGDRIVIKIDVEGHENQVLHGASSVVLKYRPVIICELLRKNLTGNNMLGILEVYGYLCFAITDSGIFRFAEKDLHSRRDFQNFLFLPEEKVITGIAYIHIPSISDSLKSG